MTNMIRLDIGLSFIDKENLKKLFKTSEGARSSFNPYIADWLTSFCQLNKTTELTHWKMILTQFDLDYDPDCDYFVHCWLTDKDVLSLLRLSAFWQLSMKNLIYRIIHYKLYIVDRQDLLSADSDRYDQMFFRDINPTLYFEQSSRSGSEYDSSNKDVDVFDIFLHIGKNGHCFEISDCVRMAFNYIPLMEYQIVEQQSTQKELKKEIASLKERVQNFDEITLKFKELTDEINDLKLQIKELQEPEIDNNEIAGEISRLLRNQPPTQPIPYKKDITPSTLGRKLAQKLNRPQIYSYYQICEAMLALGLVYNPGSATDIIRLTDKGSVYGRYQQNYTDEELNSPLERTKTRWAENVIDILLPYFKDLNEKDDNKIEKVLNFNREKP